MGIINLNIEKRKMKLLALAVIGTASAQLESGCAEGLTWESFTDDACTAAAESAFDELSIVPADLAGCSNPMLNAAANMASSVSDSVSDVVDDVTGDDEEEAPAEGGRRLQLEDLGDALSDALDEAGAAIGDALDELSVSVRLQCGDQVVVDSFTGTGDCVGEPEADGTITFAWDACTDIGDGKYVKVTAGEGQDTTTAVVSGGVSGAMALKGAMLGAAAIM